MADQENTAEVIAEGGDGAPKTAKQLEKEAKKAAKLAKLQEKLDKKAATPVAPKEKVEVSKLYKNQITQVFAVIASTCNIVYVTPSQY